VAEALTQLPLLKQKSREAQARMQMYGEQAGFYRTRTAIAQAEQQQMSQALLEAQPGFTELIQQGKVSDANLPAVTRAFTLGIGKYPEQTMGVLAEVSAMQRGQASPRAKQATGDIGTLAARIGRQIEIFGLGSPEAEDAITRYDDALERVGARRSKIPPPPGALEQNLPSAPGAPAPGAAPPPAPAPGAAADEGEWMTLPSGAKVRKAKAATKGVVAPALDLNLRSTSIPVNAASSILSQSLDIPDAEWSGMDVNAKWRALMPRLEAARNQAARLVATEPSSVKAFQAQEAVKRLEQRLQELQGVTPGLLSR